MDKMERELVNEVFSKMQNIISTTDCPKIEKLRNEEIEEDIMA